MTLEMPPEKHEIIPPEGGWKELTYYVVDISVNKNNPVHRAIMYVGFLGKQNPLAGGYTGLMRTSGADCYPVNTLYFIRAVCEIPEMNEMP